MSIELFAHNLTAYASAVSMLASAGKAAVIHPTGTGKSFIAFKLVEDNPGKKFLWLSPSEYIFKTQVEAVLREAPAFGLGDVTFYTYAKLTYLSDAFFGGISQEKPDYIILDEYHRGGALEWEKSLRKLLDACEGAKLLGLSATNIRYLDNRRDMAEELFDGYIASELSLGEAIVRHILPSPKYVVALYQYDQEIFRYQKRVSRMAAGAQEEAQKILDALKRSLDMADGLDKIFAKHLRPNARMIVFCANQEHMEAMRLEAGTWFQALDPDMHIYCVYSDNPEADSNFEQFKKDNSDHLRLLFCIDMLNEGIHVADLDGVIMLRPTISPIIYKQQLGRALSAGSSKTPLVFDIVNNFDGLYSVGAIEDEMAHALRIFPNGEGSVWEETGFTLIDEVREARQLFRQLDQALSSGWEIQFAAAKAYYETHGNLDVPKKYITEEGLSLGMWLQTQRRVYSGTVSGKLTNAQIARLEAIGMTWDNRMELSWNRYFQTAKTYFETYGDLLVPARFLCPDGKNLGKWIVNQRQAKKDGKLSRDQIEQLSSIGMVWNCADEKWETNYLEALRYFNREGNLLVPRKYITESGVRLGAWLGQMTRIYAEKQKGAAPLSQEQIQRLEAIGMVWGDRNEGQWQKAYVQAKQYFEKHGNLNVPLDYTAPDGTKLGKWVSTQRANRKSKKDQGNRLTPQRIALLDELGMDWRLEDPWEHRYELAVQYRETNGSLNIPAGYKTLDGIWLGNWLRRQKALLKKGDTASMTSHQLERLTALVKNT